MQLISLKLNHFKNYAHLEVDFPGGINCIVGKNGVGKTNLLDAIHYLSMTRSALNGIDQQNIQWGASYFAIHGQILHDSKKKSVSCYFEQGKKKLFKVQDKEIAKLSDHIGSLPCVLVAPDDTEIIREGSEVRRKFFDSVISQHDREYLESLMKVQRLLKQRNHHLKQSEVQRVDRKLLTIYDESLIPVFKQIAKRRAEFIEVFLPYFQTNYRQLIDGSENPSISYSSRVLNDHFEEEYAKSLERDIFLQRTSLGVHRDDYHFQLNDHRIKKFGSQGQQKSFLIALKLAEFDYLKSIKGYCPLLLLDDILDKLDDERIKKLIDLLLDEERFSQIFVTDARSERSRELFGNHPRVRFYEAMEGEVS